MEETDAGEFLHENSACGDVESQDTIGPDLMQVAEPLHYADGNIE